MDTVYAIGTKRISVTVYAVRSCSYEKNSQLNFNFMSEKLFFKNNKF